MENPKLTTNSVKSKLEKKHKHKKIDVSKNTDKNLKKQITEEKEETKLNLIKCKSCNNELKSNKQSINKTNTDSKNSSLSFEQNNIKKKLKKNKKSKSTFIGEKSTNKISISYEKKQKKFQEFILKLKKIIFNLKYLQKIKQKYFQRWYTNTFIIEEEEEEEEDEEEEEEEEENEEEEEENTESKKSSNCSSEKKNKNETLNNKYKIKNDDSKKKNINKNLELKNTKNKSKNIRIEEYDDELEEIQEHEASEEESVIFSDNKTSKMKKNRIIISLRKIIKYKNEKCPYFKKWYKFSKKISPLDNNSIAKKNIKNYIEKGNNQKGVYIKYFDKWNNIVKNMKNDESKKNNIIKNNINELKTISSKNRKILSPIEKLGKEIIDLSDDSQTQSELIDTEGENNFVKLNKKIRFNNRYSNNNNKKNKETSMKFKQNIINNDKKIKRLYLMRWINNIKKIKKKENDIFTIDIVPLNKSLDNYKYFKKKDIKTNILLKKYFMPDNELDPSTQEEIKFDNNTYSKNSNPKPIKNINERPIFQKRKISNNYQPSSNKTLQITSPYSNKKIFAHRFSGSSTPDRNIIADIENNNLNKIEEIQNRHKKNKLKRYLIMGYPKTTNEYNVINDRYINEELQQKLLKIFYKACCRQNKKSIYFDKWFNDTFDINNKRKLISHKKTTSYLLYKNKRAKNNFKMSVKMNENQKLSKKDKLFINIPKGYIKDSPRFNGKIYENLDISSFALGLSNIDLDKNNEKITNIDILDGNLWNSQNNIGKYNKLKNTIIKISDKNKNKKSLESLFILKKHFSIWLNKMFLHDIDDFENSKVINKLNNLIEIVNAKNEKKDLKFYFNKWKNVIKIISEININISSLKNIKYVSQQRQRDKLQVIVNNKIKNDNLQKFYNYFNQWKKIFINDSANNTNQKKNKKLINTTNNSFNENDGQIDLKIKIDKIELPKLSSIDFQKPNSMITESFELEQNSKINNSRNNKLSDEIQNEINSFFSVDKEENKRITDYNKYLINILNKANYSNGQLNGNINKIGFLKGIEISDNTENNKFKNILISLFQKLDKKFNLIIEKKYFNIWNKKASKKGSLILDEENVVIIENSNITTQRDDSNPSNIIIRNLPHSNIGYENTEGYSEETTDINLKIADNVINNIEQYKKLIIIKKVDNGKIYDNYLKYNYSFDSSKNANIDEITKFSHKNNYKDIYNLTREGNKIKNQNLLFIKKNKNSIFSQINTDKYIEILQNQNRIILAYKIYCLYVLFHDNFHIVVKRKYFKKWQKHNKIFNNSDTVNDGHIHKKNGHCENCDCENLTHCPGCFCLEKNMCFRCDCKHIKSVLKSILIRHKFLKEMNPIYYYFYLWNKNSKK